MWLYTHILGNISKLEGCTPCNLSFFPCWQHFKIWGLYTLHCIILISCWQLFKTWRLHTFQLINHVFSWQLSKIRGLSHLPTYHVFSWKLFKTWGLLHNLSYNLFITWWMVNIPHYLHSSFKCKGYNMSLWKHYKRGGYTPNIRVKTSHLESIHNMGIGPTCHGSL